MMKKLKMFFVAMVMIVSAVVCPQFFVKKQANAASNKVSYEEFSAEVNTILGVFCQYSDRIASSEGEQAAASFIFDYLSLVPSISGVNNASTNHGVQEFEFVSDYTGTYQKSQNIVFRYTAAEKTANTVILGCHYDAPAYYDAEKGAFVSIGGDMVNASSASVATLLALANYLPQYALPFNVEFVFFGASEASHAGSEFYVGGISDEQAANILCMINIDKVALGQDLYFYIDEVETDFSKYISSLFDTSKIGTKKVNTVNLNKSALVGSELGLSYSHIGLESDNVMFMKRKIATINLFAGDYDDGVVLGRCEYSNKSVITYSKYDTLEYIKTNYGADIVSKNLYKVFETVERILTDKAFVSNASGSFNQTNWFYLVFANEKLVIMLTAIIFFVVLAVAIYIHYKLTVKSYYANVEVEFLTSVVKIAEHIDAEGQDKNVPKVVGQVIANDIKKNKTLRPEKKSDKDSDKKGNE